MQAAEVAFQNQRTVGGLAQATRERRLYIATQRHVQFHMQGKGVRLAGAVGPCTGQAILAVAAECLAIAPGGVSQQSLIDTAKLPVTGREMRTEHAKIHGSDRLLEKAW